MLIIGKVSREWQRHPLINFLPILSAMESESSLLHFTYFHIHFYLLPSHIKTVLQTEEMCWWTFDVLEGCSVFIWTIHGSLLRRITNYVSEADINYLWDKSHDNDNVPWLQRSVLEISRMKWTVLTVHELDKKKNDLWNADNEYVTRKLNVKWSKIKCWNSGWQRIWLDWGTFSHFSLYFRPN